MAKRARGSTTRPGQRAPLSRATGRPVDSTASAPRPIGLTAAEEARAAEIEAGILAEERAADDARRRATERRRNAGSDTPDPVRRGVPGNLAVRAAEEYAYVGRDVRRIAILGGSLIVLLLALWIVAHATGAGPI